MERAVGEVREGWALRELLESELEPTERDGLERLGLILLRPESLAAGEGAAIVAHLTGDLRVEPVAVRVLAAVPPALVDALYNRQLKIPRTRIWLQHATLGSGPAAVLLVAAGERREPDLTTWLYARKGPTSTLEPPPEGSMRQRFGRTSSPHAVVHIPQDVAQLVAEASLFFPWATIRAAAAASLVETVSMPTVPAQVVIDLVTLEPLIRRTVFQAVVKVKRRIAAALALRVDTAAWLEPLRALTAEADADLEPLGYLEQRSRLLAFAAEERELLEAATADLEARFAATGRLPRRRAAAWRAVREAIAPFELISASWFLSGHEPYDGDGGERLFSALAEYDVPLSPPQRTLLAAALAHDLHPGARVDGERLWPLAADPGGT